MARLSKVAQKITEKYMDKLREIEAREMRVTESLYKTILKELEVDDTLFLEKARSLFKVYANELGFDIKLNQWLCLNLGLKSAYLMLGLSGYDWKPLGDADIGNLLGMKGNREKDITIELQERIDNILRVVERLIKVKADRQLIIKVLDRIPAETLRIARSEQMRAFREAQRKQLEA